ncbi:hypothetical protein [Novosphingobium sp. 9U]|uniref:hypothetical protein n=1 Tax=Novosphingobium sp. 9U TaxID=2653158 RepID=UPI001356E900|nr:hypothetical protein [Novosphingobium sp. 9U]
MEGSFDRAHTRPAATCDVRRPARELGGAALAVALRLSGWLTVNALVTLGCLTLLFLAIGGFSVSGAMVQLANLSTRYVAADAARQTEFNTILLVGCTLFFCGTAFFRRAPLARALEEIK